MLAVSSILESGSKVLSVWRISKINQVASGEGESQDLESPWCLVFVVQTVRGVEVELPGRSRRLLFVIQTVRGVEREARRAVRLVVMCWVVVMVVVAWCLADVVVGVSWHGAARHGVELVRVVVGVHRCQVGAALHAAEVGARSRGGVALAVSCLAVGHRVGRRWSSSWGGGGALHAGSACRDRRVWQVGRRRGRRDWRRAPDGRHRSSDGGRGGIQAQTGGDGGGRRGGGWRRGGGGARHRRWRELSTALWPGALSGRRRLLLHGFDLGAVGALLLLPTLRSSVLKPDLRKTQSREGHHRTPDGPQNRHWSLLSHLVPLRSNSSDLWPHSSAATFTALLFYDFNADFFNKNNI